MENPQIKLMCSPGLIRARGGAGLPTAPTPHYPLQGWRELDACCQGKKAKAEAEIILPEFTK